MRARDKGRMVSPNDFYLKRDIFKKFVYDGRRGIVRLKEPAHKRLKANLEGRKSESGMRFELFGKNVHAKQIAWLFYAGELMPPRYIKFRDGDVFNVRQDNLMKCFMKSFPYRLDEFTLQIVEILEDNPTYVRVLGYRPIMAQLPLLPEPVKLTVPQIAYALGNDYEWLEEDEIMYRDNDPQNCRVDNLEKCDIIGEMEEMGWDV